MNMYILTEGLSEVIVYQNPGETNRKNRGFAFLEYDSHKNASAAKRKLGTGRCRVWGCDLIIDWADPQEEPSEDVMATVRGCLVVVLSNYKGLNRNRDSVQTTPGWRYVLADWLK